MKNVEKFQDFVAKIDERLAIKNEDETHRDLLLLIKSLPNRLKSVDIKKDRRNKSYLPFKNFRNQEVWVYTNDMVENSYIVVNKETGKEREYSGFELPREISNAWNLIN